jgi:hypothetical protein
VAGDPPVAGGRGIGLTLPLACAVLGCGLLLYNSALRPRAGLDELRAPRRYWEDMTVAISGYLHRAASGDTSAATVGSGPGNDLRHAYTRFLQQAVEEQGIRPWQPWRTVNIKPALKRERIVSRDYDDPERAALMGAGFRLLGGVAPYLGLWLGALLGLPLLVWCVAELWAAARPLAAVVVPLMLASSCFVVDVLALPYSAVGFYVLALLLLANLAIYVLLGRSISVRGLVLRLLAGGVLFALCLLCRASTIALLPAFLLLCLLAVRRHLAARGAWRWPQLLGLAACAAAMFLLPYVALRQGGHHAIWGDVWEGLGDFDRTKGHAWFDPALRNLLRREGLRVPRNSGVEWESDESERLLRRIVLGEIREDPLWYGTILVKRLGSTVLQRRLWPYGPADGASVLRAESENEGLMNAYYSMATTVDVFGVGPWRQEIRIGLLLAPTFLLALLAFASLRWGPLVPFRPRLWGSVAVLCVIALGALVLPVGITTASALETEAFALVYLVGLGLCLDDLAWIGVSMSRTRSRSVPR